MDLREAEEGLPAPAGRGRLGPLREFRCPERFSAAAVSEERPCPDEEMGRGRRLESFGAGEAAAFPAFRTAPRRGARSGEGGGSRGFSGSAGWKRGESEMKAESAGPAVPPGPLAEFDAARERLKLAWERFGAAGPDPEDVDLALADVRAAELALASALMRAKRAGLKAWPDPPPRKRGAFSSLAKLLAIRRG